MFVLKKSATKPKGATSFRDTKFGILPRRELIKLETQGVYRGFKHIIAISKKRDIGITPELIMELHKKSFGWIFPKWAGKFRKINVEFSGKEAPQFFDVPMLVKNLCGDLKERLRHISLKDQPEKFLNETISLISWFQHRFVWIHPFNDYNGRTARLLSSFLLLKLGLPIIEIRINTKRSRDNYIRAMQAADGGDYAALEEMIAEALNAALIKGLQK